MGAVKKIGPADAIIPSREEIIALKEFKQLAKQLLGKPENYDPNFKLYPPSVEVLLRKWDTIRFNGPSERTRERIPEHVRVEVWRRDGGKCARCGSRENLEYDHIVPFSRGGGNTARKIELLCEKCNRSKSNNPA